MTDITDPGKVALCGVITVNGQVVYDGDASHFSEAGQQAAAPHFVAWASARLAAHGEILGAEENGFPDETVTPAAKQAMLAEIERLTGENAELSETLVDVTGVRDALQEKLRRSRVYAADVIEERDRLRLELSALLHKSAEVVAERNALRDEVERLTALLPADAAPVAVAFSATALKWSR